MWVAILSQPSLLSNHERRVNLNRKSRFLSIVNDINIANRRQTGPNCFGTNALTLRGVIGSAFLKVDSLHWRRGAA